MKKMMIGLLTAFILLVSTSSNVFAQHTGGGHRPIPVPEPVSILLFVASGVTYAGIRYLRARRRSKNLDKEIREINEGM